MSRGGLARRFPVLAIRDFQLLLADRLIAPASVGFSMVGVSFAVLRATNSVTDLSYVLAAQIAPSLVFALIGGVAADRFPPQRVIVAANLLMALGEGTFGVLVLTGRPPLWAMLGLEALTGTGIAIFYPASQALLPRIVPRGMLQEASAISRLAMNTGQMSGAAIAGLLVAAAGPGWALTLCGVGMVATVPLLLSIRGAREDLRPGAGQAAQGKAATAPSMLTELREGWSEFRSHTWLWVIVAQFCIVMMAWYGAFSVLGPVVAKEHLGGPAAWGAITAADSLGLIAGGLVSLRFTPRRPMLFVVLTGAAVAISPLSLAMVLPLPAVCVASFSLGVFVEMMMVQWTVALARNIPPGKLARVSSYDVLGSVMAMPAGALIAGPLGTAIGVSSAQYVAAAAIIVASALALIPRDIRTMRSGDGAAPPAVEDVPTEQEAAVLPRACPRGSACPGAVNTARPEQAANRLNAEHSRGPACPGPRPARPGPRPARLPRVEFGPHGLARHGLAHSPLGGQGIDEHESETGLVKTVRGARLRPVPVGVLDLDPQPGARGLQVQRYRVSASGVPDRVGDQLRDDQNSGLLHVGQPPAGQRVAGSVARQPHRPVSDRERHLQTPLGSVRPPGTCVNPAGPALVSRHRKPQPRCPPVDRHCSRPTR
jgi:predicted MFS family arabinose efflux permease